MVPSIRQLLGTAPQSALVVLAENNVLTSLWKHTIEIKTYATSQQKMTTATRLESEKYIF